MGNPNDKGQELKLVPSVLFFLLAGFLTWLLSVVPYDQVVLDMLAMCAVAAVIAGVLAAMGAARSSE